MTISIRGSVRVASDVGGTFTDNIAYDEATRTVTVAKVSTTPDNRALGTIAGLKTRSRCKAKRAPTSSTWATA